MPKKRAHFFLPLFWLWGRETNDNVSQAVHLGRESGLEAEITTLVFAHFIITEGRLKEAALHVIELARLKWGAIIVRLQTEDLALNHESRILGQWSNLVSESRKSIATSP